MNAIATDLSRTFTGRAAGREFGQHLRKSLRHMEHATIDFSGVPLMDASFADEAFAKLAVDRSRRAFVGGSLLLTKLTPISYDNLDIAMNARAAIDSGVRNCCQLILVGPLPTLVGKYEDTLMDTLKLLHSLIVLRTTDIMRERDCSLNAASSRLKTLYDMGLATRREIRDEQGRQFLYRWLG